MLLFLFQSSKMVEGREFLTKYEADMKQMIKELEKDAKTVEDGLFLLLATSLQQTAYASYYLHQQCLEMFEEENEIHVPVQFYNHPDEIRANIPRQFTFLNGDRLKSLALLSESDLRLFATMDPFHQWGIVAVVALPNNPEDCVYRSAIFPKNIADMLPPIPLKFMPLLGTGCGYAQCRQKEVTKLKYCSRCKKVRYCTEQCQKKDWKTHKKTCRPCVFGPTQNHKNMFYP